MRILRAAWVAPVADDPIADGALALAGDRIAAVGTWADVRAAHHGAPSDDLGDVVLAPGLIDAHCHVEWSLVGGLFSGADGFGRWLAGLLSLWPIAHGLLDDAARLAALRALQAGSTTLIDNGPTGAGVAALTEAGLRGVVHLEAFGADPATAPDVAARTADGVAALEASAGPRVAVGVSPHAPYSAGPELWRALADALPAGVPWSTHIAESQDEREALAGRGGPLAGVFAPMGLGLARWPGAQHGSSVRAMAEAGVLRDGLVAAHLVHVNADDAALLARHGVRAAHCPVSNATLRCGRSPVEALRGAGVPVALGTDSPGSAGAYDVRAEARACLATHAAAGIHHTPRQLLAMCTLDAARVIGRDDVGALVPGMRADVVAIRPPPEALPGDPHAAALDALARVEHVWVDGEPLLRDGRPLRVDAAEIETRAGSRRRVVC